MKKFKEGKQHGWITLIWKKKDEKRYIEGKVNIEILQKNAGWTDFFYGILMCFWDFLIYFDGISTWIWGDDLP